MLGHGRPVRTANLPAENKFLRVARPFFVGGRLLITAMCVCAFPPVLECWAQELPESELPELERVECELRVLWGGPQARPFAGAIQIQGGNLRFVRNLSLEPDSIGKIRNKNPATLAVQSHGPSYFGGADIAIQASLNSQLTLTFEDPLTQLPTEHSVALKELMVRNWTRALDENGAKIAIERQVHDRIRVRTDRASVVFQPGELWGAEIRGVRTGLSPGPYLLRVQITGNRTRPIPVLEQSVLIDAQGNFPSAVQVEVDTPAAEGAYQLEISLTHRRLLNSILASQADLVRRVEFISFDPGGKRSIISDFVPLARINALDASKPGMLAWLAPIGNSLTALGTPASIKMPERLQQLNPLARSLTQPIHQGMLGQRVTGVAEAGSSRDAECLTLQPGAWLAIPLHNLEPEIPHRLVIRSPSDRPFRLAMTLKQTDERQEMLPIGRDHLMDLAARECHADGRLNTHEMIFWPTAQGNYLVLSNPHEELQASILDIQVEQAQLVEQEHAEIERPESAPREALQKEPAQPELVSTANHDLTTSRLAGVYLDKPLLSDFFACERLRDPQTRRPLENWQTWQTALNRLDQYLDWTKSNLLVIKVYADGGAIFPSQRLQPSPRYDNGVFWSDGRSPEIKDAVELLMRYADRSGHRIVLALDLDSPLPAMSRIEERSEASIFQARLEAGNDASVNGRLRPYNPLNTQFQSEVSAILREIVDRYGGFKSFAGIQLQIDRDSQLVFRGDKWGYNESMLNAFQQVTQGKLPPKEQLPQAMKGSLRLAYFDWRAGELSKFFQALAKVVGQAGMDRKLYLNAARLWDEAPSPHDFLHPEAIIRNPAEFLLVHGLDPARLGGSPELVLLHGGHRYSRIAVDANGWIRQVAQQSGLELVVESPVAALMTRQPNPVRLDQFATFTKAIQTNSVPEVIYALDLQNRTDSRKDFVEQIFAADTRLLATGAWLPMTSQASALRELQPSLIALPDIPMRDFPISGEHINLRVRVGKQGTQTYLQFVNNAPWSEDLACAVQHSQETHRIQILGGRKLDLQLANAQLSNASGYGTWRFAIPPYDFIGIAVDDPQFKLVEVVHAPAAEVLAGISSEFAKLETIFSQATDPTQQLRLANVFGEFEEWTTGGQPAGWNVSSLPNVRIARSDEFPHSGRSSLLLENDNTGEVSAWIQSGSIPPPKTGRLAFQAWLRSPSVGDSGRVRLSVVGRTRSGKKFEEALDLSPGANPRVLANDWGTQPATLNVADIPKEVNELFVAIELIGRGRMWIDDVEVLQSWLHPDERIYLQGSMFVAKQKLAENNPFPAEQLLGSHWGNYLSQFQPMEGNSTASRSHELDAAKKVEASEKDQRWTDKPNVFQQLRESMRERWRR